MKKKSFLKKWEQNVFILFLFLATSVYGQNIVPQDAQVEYEKATRPCLAVTVEPSPDLLRGEWMCMRKLFRIKTVALP